MKGPLLIVEDDLIMGESLADRFALEDYEVQWCTSAEAALAELQRRAFGLIISDLRMPGMGGRELLRQVKARLPAPPPVILITGFGSIGEAVEALKEGASDYITKPFDLNELVEKVGTHCVSALPGPDCPPLGVSPPMRQLDAMLPRIARQARTILLTGESGVGKECVARRIHQLAAGDAALPFVAVNCAALPDSLLEAELFGYEKGAFTGAARSKPGLFEAASGGTLFLDEIGELALPMQSKLLRAVQEREVRRVGGQHAIPIDTRLVFATNRDLRAEVAAGRFREDLYYRINVVHLRIPPLRERREDIPWLARTFLTDLSNRQGGARRCLDPQALETLARYDWPGNVRELQHAIERACIMSPSPVLSATDILPGAKDVDARSESPTPLDDYALSTHLERCEREFIGQALRDHDGRIVDTARALGISRKGLWEKMRRLGIQAREDS